jgi:hypothetical protein
MTGRFVRIAAFVLALGSALLAAGLATTGIGPARAADDGLRFESPRVDAWEGQGRISFRVVRLGTAVALNQSRVAYKTVDLEAKAPTDYVATEGTLTLAVGQTASTIDTFLVDDNVVEDSERFEMVLLDPDDRSRILDRAIVTITDDDEPTDAGLRTAGGAGTAGSAGRSRVPATTTPPPGVVVQRPSPSASASAAAAAAAAAARRQASASSSSRSRSTPFRLYSPSPSEAAVTDAPPLSPASAMAIVAAVLLACVGARVWARWRLGLL